MTVVRIGLLLSRSGTYRLLAEACRAGALRAVREVNADPSLAVTFEPVERDPAGEADAYAPLCAELAAEGARHVVGCVTSWSRKEVIPTLERTGTVLWYPCPYEGFEASSQVVYTHACPSQHLVPLLAWALPRLGRRAILTGSNYIWGWETNRVARDLIEGAGGAVLAERHLPLGDEDVARLLAEIRAMRPDFVLNSLVGASSYAFLRAMADLRAGGLTIPILSCNLTECELPALGAAAEGLIAAGPSFGEGLGSFETAAHAAVLSLARRMAHTGAGAPLEDLLAAPDGGVLAIDPATHHATLPALIAQVRNGAFHVLERQEAVAADPYLARRPVLAAAPHLRAVAP
ncbi:amino acid/amide ABC transporter substrate-binding protein, HAAT family [Rubellimicrobium thermophilum DSM 16684]|uniref:Amino acid/amide ABC transporter substrate-binding protein, HAAT family n=1 Tax=Rubellimicrobium thermophilum DSM 16684 TaxID=1123069 RepID=S9R7G9_9RHOB|nr:transporter substrate-binding protein [Rubellimicrobium thermophilum]EPX87847.1 amino acid/amide ABC transporter substrate-binding protein, HAAT family [Rubellimicrobium thermophilum DSM 16684]